MHKLSLETLDPKDLNILSNDRDVLRDVLTFVDFVRERSIKRMTRSNEIPHAELLRLAKLMGIDPPEKDGWMYARPYWINFIDSLALRLQLVSYDLKGEYRGYSSSEPSFIDNYIKVDDAHLRKFLELSPAEQEKKILDTLNRATFNRGYDNTIFNEVFYYSPLGFLDPFESWGSGTGIFPTLKFAEIRQFLLDLLQRCDPGQWLSVSSLSAYLKANHPYFLIPEKIPTQDRWGTPVGRYDNFYESNANEARKVIPADAPDAFERVEGRYVERFFEYIPLIMRFVDLAYDPAPYKGRSPERGVLKAFRINERFLRLMSGEAAQPRLTIQPNFDIVLESEFYPASLIRLVAAMGEQVSSPNSGHGAYVGIFQLKKSAVAALLVQQPGLDVSALLKRLSGRDLPPNVQVELDEWAGHADQFTLYEGFALLEAVDFPPEVEQFTAESISPTLRLVRGREAVFGMLETLGQVPLRIGHAPREFSLLAETAVSVFPREAARSEAPQAARQVKIGRSVTVSYRFPEDESFAAVQKMLAELRCPFHSDPQTRIISLLQKEQGKFDEALQKLQADFSFEIE